MTNMFVGRSIQISKVTASLQVQYSGVGDLNVFMWSPAGTRTKLLERNCGGLVNIDTTFDDSASSSITTSAHEADVDHSAKMNRWPNWNGQNAFGYWRLGVENNGSSRTGTVTGFSITITGIRSGPPRSD